MASDSNASEMRPNDLRSFLAAERENGFQSLTQAQRNFAIEFTKCASHIEAAKNSDIPVSQALRTLRDPVVSCFINYLNQQKEHYSLIDASFIEVQYLGLLSKLLGEEDVRVMDREGDVREVRVFHSSESVALLRDLAKISGHYKDDPTTVINVASQLTEEQQAILDTALDAKY